jgi:hypothetical protein
MSEPYRRKRSFYQDVSGSLANTAFTTSPSTLVDQSKKPNDTIFVQKIHANITGPASDTWQVQDSTGINVTDAFSAATAGNIGGMGYDFGPEGIPLVQGASLILTLSGLGSSGYLTWEAYSKRVAVVAA